jgi:HSP20 family protein
MMLMRTDPFRELERLIDDGRRAPRSFPMDAYRNGDEFVMAFDLPGLRSDEIELTVERNVLTVKADRRIAFGGADEVAVSERPQGVFTRQVFLGDTLDAERINADYTAGVLTLRVPVAESAKPRQISVASGEETESRTLEASNV